MLEGNTLRAKLVENTPAQGTIGFKGERGYSNYELAVQNGYVGTEQEWIDHFGVDLTGYLKTTDIVDNVTTNNSSKPLSAAQGRYLKNYIDAYTENEIGNTPSLDTTSKIVVGAINEVNTSIGNTDTKIGALSSLTTTTKSSIVGAINEVKDDEKYNGDTIIFSKNGYENITSGLYTNLEYPNKSTSNTNVDFISYDSDTRTYTITVEGLYLIIVNNQFGENANGSRRQEVSYNSTPYGMAGCRASNSGKTWLSSSCILKFNANDTFVIRGYQDSGSTLGVDFNSRFYITKLK